MKLKLLSSMLLIGSLFVVQANDYERANSAAKEAFSDLDCEFEDCTKEEPKPKVIIKERVVEKPVIKERVIYRDRVVYKERPKEELTQRVVETKKSEPPQATAGVVYNKAFFDIHPKSQAPILDYISYSSRSSFDINQFVDSVKKIKESGIKAYIYGRLAVPKSIQTDEVYVKVGGNYYKNDSWWKKLIYYNDSSTAQNAEYFLVNVQEDEKGRRYIKYKIYFLLDYPWKVTPSSTDVIPTGIYFQVAPKVRGFKNKFIKATPYIVEE